MIAIRTAAFLVLLLPLQALAWSSQGHRVIAEISSHFLSDAAWRGVAAMLAAERTLDPASPIRTLADAATWADDVRATRPEARRWHFDDVPLCGARDRTKYCAGDDCASAQIERLRRVLGDRSAPLAARVDSFKYLVHFVADIHQPLHAADNDDRGGNALPVIVEWAFAPEALPGNLHRLWDLELPARLLRERGMSSRAIADSITRGARHEWSQGSAADWIDETHQIARAVAYGALPEPPARGAPPPAEPIRIGHVYYNAARPALLLLIKRAAVRVALVLNSAFAE